LRDEGGNAVVEELAELLIPGSGAAVGVGYLSRDARESD